jgi:hypothetical protein
MSKPSHIAYVVNKNPDDDKKGFWRQVGAVWPHKNGNGFDLVIFDQVAVSGRIVCTVPKEKEDKTADEAEAQ